MHGESDPLIFLVVRFFFKKDYSITNSMFLGEKKKMSKNEKVF
jgi:hypothetical protein